MKKTQTKDNLGASSIDIPLPAWDVWEREVGLGLSSPLPVLQLTALSSLESLKIQGIFEGQLNMNSTGG